MWINIKKILLWLFSIITIYFSFIWTNIALEKCNYDGQWWLVKTLTDCIDEPNFKWVVPEDNLDLSTWIGVSKLVTKIVKNISIILFIIAVWALIYASYLLVLSGWEEEKIKKAKDIIKWTLLWFIWLISAWLIIMLVVKVGYYVGT